MARAPFQRLAALLVLFVIAGAMGCTHNYYFGSYVPGQYGEVCEVPSQVSGGTVMAQSRSPTTVGAAPDTTTVLVSEPQFAGPFFRGPRFAWRRPDPESLITTRVEGGIDGESVTR
jgi:hypothetical protein